MNDDQLQRSSSTETSNRRRQLLPEQCATVDAEKSPNARHHQDGDYAYQGGHTVAEIPAIRK